MNNQQYKNSLVLFLILIVIASCNLDNYNGPTQTLKGTIIDKNTGKPIQTETGGGGVRIELDELSWSKDPTPYYFSSKQNGTFKNTKIFKGKYRISIQGAFVPLLQKNDNGDIVVDKRKTMKIRGGVTKVNFKVTPLLEIKWVGKPVINSDSTVTVKFKITRGTDNAKFQPNVTDIGLFVNRYRFAGNYSFNSVLSQRLQFSGTDGNEKVGKTMTLTTAAPLNLNGVEDWFIRVGAKTDFGLQHYNYNEPVEINFKDQ
jgi:hypothetical protein